MTEPPAYPGAPRWLKWFGIVVLVLLLLILVVGHLLGGHRLHSLHGSP